MKKIYMFIALMALSLVVVACGTSNNEETPVTNEPNVEENNPNGTDNASEMDGTNGNDGTAMNANQGEAVADQNEMQKKMDELDYADFELSAEYTDNKEYEAELEKNSNNTVEAKIEDTLTNVEKTGSDAFNELFPLVKQLTITQQTSKEDAIKEVLDVFGLPADYTEFDMEIRFKDGTKIEFDDRK